MGNSTHRELGFGVPARGSFTFGAGSFGISLASSLMRAAVQPDRGGSSVTAPHLAAVTSPYGVWARSRGIPLNPDPEAHFAHREAGIETAPLRAMTTPATWCALDCPDTRT